MIDSVFQLVDQLKLNSFGFHTKKGKIINIKILFDLNLKSHLAISQRFQ